MTMPETHPVPAESSQALLRLLGRQPRMLLAEDDDDVRWCLSTVFEIDGFRVAAVSNGVEFLEEIASTMLLEKRWLAPDVIVTDIRMPGFNVLNIIEGLRAAGWHTPVMVISAFGDTQMRERVRELSAEFFEKPLDIDELERAVVRAVADKVEQQPSPSSQGL